MVASTGHLGTTTEVKPSGVVSHGVKGVTRYPTQSKGTSQQPVQQLQDIFSSQPANIFGDGYLEPVVVGGSSSPSNVITGIVSITDNKEKEGGFFRSFLPWRWVSRTGNGAPAPVADESSNQVTFNQPKTISLFQFNKILVLFSNHRLQSVPGLGFSSSPVERLLDNRQLQRTASAFQTAFRRQR